MDEDQGVSRDHAPGIGSVASGQSRALDEETDRPIIDGWYAKAREQTPETFGAFLQELVGGQYVHDYGTICHATAAAALGAAWAVNASPSGGISGFQGGAIMWEFITHWQSLKGHPLRLIDYNDLLYPQMEHKFRTVSPETFDALRAKARDELAKPQDLMHPDVRRHMQSVADGYVPFGLRVEAA